MESKIFELNNMNQRLTNEVERTKGSSKVEEEAIRKEVEEYFKVRLDFKDSEIEQMANKVAKISQINIEFTNKINRL